MMTTARLARSASASTLLTSNKVSSRPIFACTITKSKQQEPLGRWGPALITPIFAPSPPPRCPLSQEAAGHCRTMPRTRCVQMSCVCVYVLACPRACLGQCAYYICLGPQLSRQMVELFEACQQQASDLSRKEMCRTRLQRDIQNVFPCM